MTKPKPKVLHVVITPELHKRLTDVGQKEIDHLKFEMSMSDVVRWVLARGLESIESEP